ncbi:MAG: glycoside hydrolase [Methylococcaceae bacterium]|nr:glycoside hydrolase [Methylococcaceae bacterium]
MIRSNRSPFTALCGAVLVFYSAITPSAEDPATAPASGLILSDAVLIGPSGGRNPNVAVDPNTGAVYLAWAQEVIDAVAAPPLKDGKKADPKLEVRLARSDDGGRHFGAPVVVNSPEDRVKSYSVSPTRVAVGSKGEIYVLYGHEDRNFSLPGNRLGREVLRLARSGDGGRSFTAPIEIGSESVEGVATSLGMNNLFVAPDGALYASWLDTRDFFAYLLAHKKEPPKEQKLLWQLRVARSNDGGRSFAKSTLVAQPVCGCCGTKVAQGKDGPVYASTRAAWPELKGSVDQVRDIIVSTSQDHGATWSEAVKVHNDRFKISGCPDVTPGLSVDSRGRLHAAWYTGAEGRAGIYYAVSADQGQSFSEPLALLTDEWVPYADVKLALDSQDNAWVAFEDRRGESDLIHLVRVDRNGTVSRAEPWSGTIPDVAAHGDSAVVAWGGLASDNEDSGGAVHVRVARPGDGS